MKNKVTKKHGAILYWIAVLILTFGFIGTTNAEPIGLGTAERFLFLTPTRIYEGGGGNSYIGDIGAPEITGWNPNSFVGIWVDDQATLNTAVTDAFWFSELLLRLPADDVISSPYPGQWSTVKPGLNVVTVLGGTLEPTILPHTIVGSATQTVVLNVLATGEVSGGIQTTGGLLPEKLIVNYIGPSQVRLGLGSRRAAGTYLIRSGTVMYGTGSGGLDGAVIVATNVDINIGGGSNLFIRRPFNPSAIPELSTLIGLEIVGPEEVAENFRDSYKAIAYYDDDSTRDATNLATWAVEPNTSASIDGNGILTTKDVVREQVATILASYTDGQVTVDAEKPIHIFPICPTGTALSFDGVDDYVEVEDIGVTGDWTVEFWAELDTVAPDIQYPIGTGLGAASRPAGIFMAYSKAEAGRWGIYDGVSYHVGSVVSAGVWYYVAVTKSGTTYTLYLNGNFENGVSLADIDISNLQIGRRSDNRWYVDGLIDEVRIYDRALSAEEIQANMHTRLTGDEPGLVGYWDFDEGDGQIVYDLSGNGNDGQLGSAPDVDNSDPTWVDSDAPIGMCSLYQIATMTANGAVERKTALLEELLAALAEEWMAYEALEELLEGGDYGDLNKGDIVTAKQKIHSATQHEEQSIDALEKSIEKLKDALNLLGY